MSTPGEIALPKPDLAPERGAGVSAETTRAVAPSFGLTAGGEPERLVVLDGLRGVAILAVLVLHFMLMTPGNRFEAALLHTAELGWIGVDLFFVLSGFLITGILWDSRGQPGYFVRFYARRTVRIFPLYYAYLFAVMVVLPAFVASYAAEYAATDNRIWLWTYTSNVLTARDGWEHIPTHTSHLWSLAIEEQFYLLWPLVVWRASWRGLAAVCVGVIVASPLVRLGLNLGDALPTASYTLLPARMDGLAAGALLALVLRRDYSPVLLHRVGRGMVVAAVALLAVLAAYGHRLGWNGVLPALEGPVEVVGYSLIAIGCSGLLLYAVTAPTRSRIRSFLSAPVLRAFGQYSYGLYVLHVPLRNLIRQRMGTNGGLPRLGGSELPAQLVMMAGAIALSYGVAMVSWHLYEKHWLRLKRFFPYGRETR